MKKTLFFSFGLCFLCANLSLNLSAQEYKNFDLNKYYTPDIVRNGLGLTFSANDNIYNRKTSQDSTVVNNFYWYFSPSFSSYKNTRKSTSIISIGGLSNGNIEKNKQTDNSDYRNYSNSDNSFFANYASYFYSKKQNFLTIKISGNYNGTYQNDKKSTNNTSTNSFFNSSSYDMRPSIGIGKGRIELITDARQAIYILDELSSKNKLTNKLSNDEVFNFAQTISKVKNKRFLDARLRKIEEITTVDSFLVKNNYITSQDATYFTTLNDYWEYGALFERYSGHSIELNISPNISFGNSLQQYLTSDTENSASTLAFNKEINLIYRFEKSAGLNWQHSFSTNVGLNFSDYTNESIDYSGNLNKTEEDITSGTLAIRYSLNYFPSTRSRISAYANHYSSITSYDNIKTNNIAQASSYSTTTNLATGIVADYYFSQQLRLSTSIGASYSSNYISNYNLPDGWFSNLLRFGIGASVAYSFF